MPELLDIPQAIEQAGGNPELAKELFSMLMKELPGMQTKLNQAFNADNLQGLWDQVHKIYGATAYLGVPTLQKAARDLETAIKSQANDVTVEIQALNKVIEALRLQGQALLEQDW